MRDPRHNILFEEVAIGPVTARNRFYQVPHCNGMGTSHPSAMAAMREVKAEGGWSVVCTEECDFHHVGDVSPAVEARLWTSQDIPAMARMVESVKRHGALAGCELVFGGPANGNLQSREIPLAPVAIPVKGYSPVQARGMDLTDIANFRRWHRDAICRVRDAGFDLVYVYAGHDLSLLQHFLSRRYNRRTDAYGGSIENRARLLREVIEDSREVAFGKMAVAVRIAVDELMGKDGITAGDDGQAVIELLADLPDLWDVNISDWENDSQTARFADEGYQERFVSWVKSVTTKPVVMVGRYTSVDRMVSLVQKGITDFIGAARPSIADPFLPRKIEEGRIEDIRECIGCNICVAGDWQYVPMRCTQNPTVGEEWRRGWHPEKIVRKRSDAAVLIVGAGPAGLEAARALGRRGYQVALAEAEIQAGGHLNRIAELPGFGSWRRVRDWRVGQISQMSHVELYPGSRLTVDDVLEFGEGHIAIATGARWRRDGIGRSLRRPLVGSDCHGVLTPDDILNGVDVRSPVIVFDDDHYFMASAIAELVASGGHDVVYVTPAPDVAHWTHNTMEQHRIQSRLLELEVRIVTSNTVSAVDKETVALTCGFSGKTARVERATFVPVTMRTPEDGLYRALLNRRNQWESCGIKSVTAIGDCHAPGLVAAAVYSGHRFARELDAKTRLDEPPFAREVVSLSANWPTSWDAD